MRMKSVLLSAVTILAVLPCVAQDGAPARPKITGISFVRFYESDMDAARVFYRERLGLREVGRGPQFNEFEVNSKQVIVTVPLAADASPNRLASVGFRTTDLNAMERYLQAKQIAVEQMPGPSLRLHSPEGTEVWFEPDQPVKRKGDIEVLFFHGKAFKPAAARIIHAGWGVRDEAAEDKLFVDVLGFRPYWHGGAAPDKTEWVSLQVPDGTDWIEYMLKYDPEHDSPKTLGVLDHVSLGVEKITDVSDRLAANGWADEATRKTQIGKDGKWQLNVYDPDMSRVEFMEFKPVQKPCCSEFTGTHPAQGDKEP